MLSQENPKYKYIINDIANTLQSTGKYWQVADRCPELKEENASKCQ